MSTVFATTNKELLIFTLPTDSLSPDSTFNISRFSTSFSLSTLVCNRFIFFIGHSNDHGTDYRNVFCINHPRHEIVDAPSLLSAKFRPTLIVCESKLFAFTRLTRWQHIDCPQSSDIFGEVLDTDYRPWNWQALLPLPTLPPPQYSLAFVILAFAVLAPSTIFLSFGSLNDIYVYVEGEFSITYDISSGTWGDISKALPFHGEAKFSERAGIFYALPCGQSRQNNYFLGSYRLNNDDFSWVELCQFPLHSESPYILPSRVQSFAVSSRNTIFSIRVKIFKPTHSSPTRHFIEFDEIELDFDSGKQEDGCLIGESYVNYHFSYTSMDAIKDIIC